MISLETFLLFLIPMLIVNLSPGPAMIYAVGQTLAYGKTIGLLSIIGLEMATFLHVITATLGLSALMMANPHLIVILQLMGAGYLIYLGIKEIRAIHHQAPATHVRNKDINRWHVLKQGFIINILNPKLSLFFLAFLPPFIDVSRDDVSLQFFTLGFICNLSGLLVNVTAVFLAAALGRIFAKKVNATEHSRTKNIVIGVVYFSLAVAIIIRIM